MLCAVAGAAFAVPLAGAGLAVIPRRIRWHEATRADIVGVAEVADRASATVCNGANRSRFVSTE